MTETAKYAGLSLVIVLAFVGALEFIAIFRDRLTEGVQADPGFAAMGSLIGYTMVVAVAFTAGAIGWASWHVFSKVSD